MIKYIPIIGPWLTGYIEENIAIRVSSSVIASLITATTWTIIIGFVAIFGIIFNVSFLTKFIIDIMIITYLIQSISGAIKAIREAINFLNSWFSFFTGITVMGFLNIIALPLLSLLPPYCFVILFRSYLGYNFGGGLKELIFQTIHKIV